MKNKPLKDPKVSKSKYIGGDFQGAALPNAPAKIPNPKKIPSIKSPSSRKQTLA